MKPLIVLLSCLTSFNIHAQITNLPGAANDVMRTRKYAEYEGTPYLVEDWTPGSITDKRGQVYSNILLRYDSFKRNVEVSSADGTLLVTAQVYPRFVFQSVDKAGKLKSRSFVANVNPAEPDLYVEELVIGDYSFFKQYKTELIEETVSGYGTSSSKKVFRLKTDYFVKVKGELKSVKLSKPALLEAMPEAGDAIEKFTRDNKLKMKSEQDFVQLFDFLNK